MMKNNILEELKRNKELMGILKEQELNVLLSDTTISTSGDKMSISYEGNKQCFKLWVKDVGIMDVDYAAKQSDGIWDIDFVIPYGKGTIINLMMGEIKKSLPNGVTAEHLSGGAEDCWGYFDCDRLDLRIDPDAMGWDAEEFKRFLQGGKVLDFKSDDCSLEAYSC